jgi:hypothetical protein
VTIVWQDHGTNRSHVQSAPIPYGAPPDPTDPEKTIETLLDELYFEMLVRREKIKLDDMKEIHAVRIPKSHLRLMYEHMEQPGVVEANNEVLGYWIVSAYDIHNGTLPMGPMDNPPLSDQIVRTIDCKLKDTAVNTNYHYVHPSVVICQTLPEKEAEMIMRERKRALDRPGKPSLVFTGASRALNWHKHPDWLAVPSGGDITEAMRDIDIQYPGVETYPYTIALRIREDEIARLSRDPKVCVLPKATY